MHLALAAGALIGTWNWELPTDRFTVDEAFARNFGGAGAHTVEVVTQLAGRTARTVADQTVQAAENVTVEAMVATQAAGEQTQEAAHEAQDEHQG